MNKQKEVLVRVTAKDCRWDYFNGQGKGGQHRNKKANCVRCFHDPSGAMGQGTEHKSKDQNKRQAFERMANSKEFQNWIKLESMKKNGQLAQIEYEVDVDMIKNTSVETKNEEGKWEEDEKLSVNKFDVDRLKEN